MSPKLEMRAEDEWGAAVGALLVRRLDARPGSRLCLPTGDTPEPAYAAFAALGGSLAATDVFLLDEFLLPDGHQARCDVMLRRMLLDRLEEAPRRFHRLDVGAADLDAECARYDTLAAARPFDLILLGLGSNGHIGLNEPGIAGDSATRVVKLHPGTVEHAAHYGKGARPEFGVTLGMKAILASHEVWLLVTGRHKAEILERALTGPIGPDVPASYLQRHPDVTVFADTPAAELLSS
ncbi:MAG: glucosamine-6-phosphate deaminase [Acidimicrobiia bacterium]|nr:glucosamine-6-phosphate deaminase [Acidimicrobiia bacterium]